MQHKARISKQLRLDQQLQRLHLWLHFYIHLCWQAHLHHIKVQLLSNHIATTLRQQRIPEKEKNVQLAKAT